jgi:hypothetical protein
VYAANLPGKQRVELVEQARQAYTSRLEAARSAVRAATDPYAKAAAEFAVSHSRAVLKLLDSIPSD